MTVEKHLHGISPVGNRVKDLLNPAFYGKECKQRLSLDRDSFIGIALFATTGILTIASLILSDALPKIKLPGQPLTPPANPDSGLVYRDNLPKFEPYTPQMIDRQGNLNVPPIVSTNR